MQEHISNLEGIISENIQQVEEIVNKQPLQSYQLHTNVKLKQEGHSGSVHEQSNSLLGHHDERVHALEDQFSVLSGSFDEWCSESRSLAAESVGLSGSYLNTQKERLHSVQLEAEANIGIGV